MPTTRGSTSRRRGVPKRRPPQPRRPQSVLILHLDSEKLAADGLHLGPEAAVSGQLAAILGGPVTIASCTSRSTLLSLLGELHREKRKFDVVVVVAHSNEQVIRIASDEAIAWTAFSMYLKPFKPRRLLLVACKAGRSTAGEALFSNLGELRRVFACPVNASRDFGTFMLALVPYVTAKRAPKDKHVLWAQMISVGATGCQLREWRRTADKGNPDSVLFDLLADLAEPVARKVPAVITDLLGSLIGR